MTLRFWPGISALRSNRWRIGCRPYSGPGRRVSPSSLCVSIKPAQSPNAILQRGCNSRALAAPARCGMFTAPLRRRAVFCGNWPKRLMGCAILVWRAISRNRRGGLGRQCGATRFLWGVRCAMRPRLFTPMGWISIAQKPLSRLAFPAVSANAAIAINVLYHRWNGSWLLTRICATCCPIG